MLWMTKKVEDVLKTFNKAVKQLEEIEERRTKELGELNDRLVVATEEKNKAVRIKDKLEKLLE